MSEFLRKLVSPEGVAESTDWVTLRDFVSESGLLVDAFPEEPKPVRLVDAFPSEGQMTPTTLLNLDNRKRKANNGTRCLGMKGAVT